MFKLLALPETSLGLVPGWGGTYLLPRLVGLETALDVMLTRPARNKPYKAPEAVAIGLADVLFDSADFLKESIQWAAHVISGEVVVSRPSPTAPERWDAVLSAARQQLSMTTHDTLPAPHTLLNLLALGPHATRDEGFAAEDDALEHLIMSDEFRASIYAFNAINAAKHPKNVPSSHVQRTIQRVGIVGAGLMAAQLALLFSQRLDIPVIMRDIDQHRVDKGLAHVASTLEKLTQEGRLTEPEAAKIRAGIHGTTHIEDFSQCDFIIEAVTENLPLKKAVFAELEGIVSAETILATNTSALSITAMSADLKHPERVVGIHFFNPVARMPLVEVIRTSHTSEETLATAFALTQTLKKTAVIAADRPGFIVNRLLILLMGKVVETIEQGTSVTVADQALRPLGLPMGPFALFDLVGPAVGLHVLTTLRDELGTRFPHSPGLERIVADQKAVSHKPHGTHLPAVVDPSIAQYFGTDTPPDQRKERSAAEVLDHVLSALTTEIGLMLDEGAVADPTDIDVSMILGAGWSFAAGGITPYLDRTGYSERILGKRFHPAGVASVPVASTTQ
ncbi:3-hydroxyacyl-CoA dehydrogenase NAD-binding domain-containing protein [Timonella sp. A28]|uniref:3-hydroxyacyl-CoA dehydrogenase NAD-binding domain-containing protein n=1 Tax=Timonella sp. A28 TaxID=3442640 RepID=UPI003EBED0F2